ncbi:MAG: mannitol dehydrogenase family protein [Clostridiales bacterium]|jgi:fructuronate reductase|nr:mannitol dehydrogenase family protein [Clostridiales bacterium]
MKLSVKTLNEPFWAENGFITPKFEVTQARERTVKDPLWLHFGAGNIFRVFTAAMQQKLLDDGLADRGIIVCETYDEELIPAVYKPYDNLTVGVTLGADGSAKKTVIASICESLNAGDSPERLAEIFTNPSLQIVSFTITEKGYTVTPGRPGIMNHVTQLLHARYSSGGYPLTFMSLDNCSKNGDILRRAVIAAADNNDKGFIEYINTNVSFPLSMIDKITPRPSEKIKDMLESLGLEDCGIIETCKHTFAALFVNAEEPGYLVVEDSFKGGRPPLERAGMIFTDRETVEKVEKMKVGTCLNPLHTALAVFGCLLGYTSVAEEMKDQRLAGFIRRLGYEEGLPAVTDPGIIYPKDFMEECLSERFTNPFVPDTPQRIVCDTSQKIPVRFGGTVKYYIETGAGIAGLEHIPLFFAGWLKYLTGIDDAGKAFTQSPDPMLEELGGRMRGVSVNTVSEAVRPILSNAAIFGVNLYEHGLGDKVESIFKEMLPAGGVSRLLERYGVTK